MNDKNQGLNERLEHKKRIQRMKTGLIWFVFTWMLALMLISVTLIAKVISLQEQIDIITENTIRSQQVEQQKNQTSNIDYIQKYGGLQDDENDEDKRKEDSEGSDSKQNKKAKSEKNTDNTEKKENTKEKENTDSKEEARKVYLTFDDGPSKNTTAILDILDEYHVKATFFVTGREDEASLARYKEITDRGHTIGMHSYSHKYEAIYESVRAFKKDLKRIQNTIKEATGKNCKLYRFPGGSSNQVSHLDMKEFIRVLNEKGITYFDWNAECGDATSHSYTAEEMVDNVMKDVVKYHTSVVLMHDAENKPNTVEALPMIIEQLQALDAKILPIDKNTTVVQHVSADEVEE